MNQNSFRRDVHRALDGLARPVPGLHSLSMAAVRAKDVAGVERGSRLGWLAGATALLLTLAVVGVFQLTNGALLGHTPAHPGVDSEIWVEDLTLTGDVSAHVTSTVANKGAVRSACTGKTSRAVGKYSLTLAFSTDHGVWQFDVLVDLYQGPGTYTIVGNPNSARALIVDPARTAGSHSGPDDTMVFTVDSTEEAGTVSATMSVPYLPATSTTPETINGAWSCRTSQ